MLKMQNIILSRFPSVQRKNYIIYEFLSFSHYYIFFFIILPSSPDTLSPLPVIVFLSDVAVLGPPYFFQ